MPNSRRRAQDDSLSGQRLQSACIRACDSRASVKRAADRLNEELDQVTAPGGVQVGGLSEEDSMVTTVAAVIEKHAAKLG